MRRNAGAAHGDEIETDAPRERIGRARPSHRQNGPTTLTRTASGAQTAKRTPATPSIVVAWAPSDCQRLKWRPSLNR